MAIDDPAEISNHLAATEVSRAAMGVAGMALARTLHRASAARLEQEIVRSRARGRPIEALERKRDKAAAEVARAEEAIHRAKGTHIEPVPGAASVAGRVLREGVGVAELTVTAFAPGGEVRGASVTREDGSFSLASRGGGEACLVVSDARRTVLSARPQRYAFEPDTRHYIEIALDDADTRPEPEIPDKPEAPPAESEREVAVPDIVGMSEHEALATLVDVGLVPGQRREAAADARPGVVVRQAPRAAEPLREGSPVAYVVAAAREGPQGDDDDPASDRPKVPSLLGTGPLEARKLLDAGGLSCGVIMLQAGEGDDPVVREQAPRPGAAVPEDAHVSVGFSVDLRRVEPVELVPRLAVVHRRYPLGSVDPEALASRLRRAGVGTVEELQKLASRRVDDFAEALGIPKRPAADARAALAVAVAALAAARDA